MIELHFMNGFVFVTLGYTPKLPAILIEREQDDPLNNEQFSSLCWTDFWTVILISQNICGHVVICVHVLEYVNCCSV